MQLSGSAKIIIAEDLIPMLVALRRALNQLTLIRLTPPKAAGSAAAAKTRA